MGSVWALLESHFCVVLKLWGQTLDSFCDLSRKGLKQMQKRIHERSWNTCISKGFLVLSGKRTSAFRPRQRERNEAQVSTLLAACLHFRCCFCICFKGFWTTSFNSFSWVGGRDGIPSNAPQQGSAMLVTACQISMLLCQHHAMANNSFLQNKAKTQRSISSRLNKKIRV